MAIDFPSSPNIGDTVTGPYGEVYTWSGDAWGLTTGGSGGGDGGGGAYLPLTGGTISGNLAITGTETIGGGMSVTNDASFGGNVTVAGALIASGVSFPSVLGGYATVSGHAVQFLWDGTFVDASVDYTGTPGALMNVSGGNFTGNVGVPNAINIVQIPNSWFGMIGGNPNTIGINMNNDCYFVYDRVTGGWSWVVNSETMMSLSWSDGSLNIPGSGNFNGGGFNVGGGNVSGNLNVGATLYAATGYWGDSFYIGYLGGMGQPGINWWPGWYWWFNTSNGTITYVSPSGTQFWIDGGGNGAYAGNLTVNQSLITTWVSANQSVTTDQFTVSAYNGTRMAVNDGPSSGVGGSAWYGVTSYSFNNASDIDEKTDITDLISGDSLATVRNVRAIQYRVKMDADHKDPTKRDRVMRGFAAQEFNAAISRINPEKTINVMDAVAVLWSAVQELAARLEAK